MKKTRIETDELYTRFLKEYQTSCFNGIAPLQFLANRRMLHDYTIWADFYHTYLDGMAVVDRVSKYLSDCRMNCQIHVRNSTRPWRRMVVSVKKTKVGTLVWIPDETNETEGVESYKLISGIVSVIEKDGVQILTETLETVFYKNENNLFAAC